MRACDDAPPGLSVRPVPGPSGPVGSISIDQTSGVDKPRLVLPAGPSLAPERLVHCQFRLAIAAKRASLMRPVALHLEGVSKFALSSPGRKRAA